MDIMRSLLRCFLILQYCALLAVTSEKTPYSGIAQVLTQLNAAYKIELNIFINLEYDSQDTLAIQHLDTPSLQLQLSSNFSNHFKILGRFTEQTLIVAYLKRSTLDAVVADFLPRLLMNLHELLIVFISAEQPNNWQQDLYSYCFREGFINVLLIHQHDRRVSFYSYNPYPVIRIMQFQQLEEYLNRWRQLLNLQHFPIRTIFFTVIPRSIQYVNRHGKLVRGGYMHHIFKEFARHHNATLQILQHVTNEEAYNTTLVLMRSKAMDIVYNPKEFGMKASGTITLYLLKIHITVPHARPIASYLYFTRPFTWTLWLAVIGTIGYGMLMLYGSNGNTGSQIGEHFLSSWCHLLFVSQPLINISNWQQFVIHFLLMLSGFILTNFYLAQLSSMLTSGLFEPQYNTLEDLAHAPYPLYMSQYYAEYLKQSNSLPAAVLSLIRTDAPNVVDDARIALNTSYMFIGYDDRNDGVLYQQHLLKVPLFKLMTQSLLDGLMSFPVANGLPYLNMLNIYLRRIFEFGILAKMIKDAWRDAIESGLTKLMRGEGLEQKPYDLEFYFYAFALWAVGLTLAGLCFLLELLRRCITKKYSQIDLPYFN